MKKLYKNRRNKMLFGVCSGLSDYFSIDVVVIRLLFLVATLFLGVSVWVYVVLGVILPYNEDEDIYILNDDSNKKKLYRLNYNKMIFGVCSGLEDYLEIDVTIIRLVFLIATIFFGVSIWFYIILAIIIPLKDEDSHTFM